MGLLDAPPRKPFTAGIVGFGHSFLRIGAYAQQLSIYRLAGIIGAIPVKNNGVSGSTMVLGDQTVGKSNGGFAAIFQKWQRIPSSALTTANLAPQSSVPVLMWGINDAGHMKDLTVAEYARYRTAYKHTLRACIGFLSGAVYLEAETAFPNLAINTTFAGSGSWTAVTNESRWNSGTGYRHNSTSGGTITHATTGLGDRWINMIFLCPSAGLSTPGSVISFTLDGVTVYPQGFSASVPFDTSNILPAWPGQPWSTLYPATARFFVPSGNHSLVATSSTGGMNLDSIVYEGDYTPPMLINNVANTPGTNSSSGTFFTTPQAVASLNDDMESVVDEFDSNLIKLVDMNDALGNAESPYDESYWTTAVDTTHPNAYGNLQMTKAMYNAFTSMPLNGDNISNLAGPREIPVCDPVMAVATTSITLSAASVVDGYTPQMNDRILATAQSTAANNGPWIVNTGGAWTRPVDFATGTDVAGKSVFVRGGTVYAGSVWTLPTTSPCFVDTTSQSWRRPEQAANVTVTQSATPTINTDVTDIATITGLAQAITSFTTNLSGTPSDGDKLVIRITDNGTGRAITWGASFEASTVALPTTTVSSTLLTVEFMYNSVTSKWRCIRAV